MGFLRKTKKLGTVMFDSINDAIKTNPSLAKKIAVSHRKVLRRDLEKIQKVLFEYQAKIETYSESISKMEDQISDLKRYAVKAKEDGNKDDVQGIFIKIKTLESQISTTTAMREKSQEFVNFFSSKVKKAQNQVEKMESIIIHITALADTIKFNKTLSGVSVESKGIDTSELSDILTSLKEQCFVSEKMAEAENTEDYEEKYGEEDESSDFNKFYEDLS